SSFDAAVYLRRRGAVFGPLPTNSRLRIISGAAAEDGVQRIRVIARSAGGQVIDGDFLPLWTAFDRSEVPERSETEPMRTLLAPIARRGACHAHRAKNRAVTKGTGHHRPVRDEVT